MELNIFTFPFEQIGWALRQLSLSGAIGNVFAIIIYLFIGAIPAGIFLLLKKKGKSHEIDIMLLVLCVLLFVLLYYMINPGLIATTVPGSGKAMWGSVFYSLLVAYLVIRAVIKNEEKDLNTLQKNLRIVLILIMVLFAVSVVVEMFVNLPSAWAKVEEGNTGTGTPLDLFYGVPDLTLTYVFLVMRSIVTALPNGLSAIAVFFCIKALEELISDSYSEKAVAIVRKIIVFCKKSVILVAVLGMIINVAQLVFESQLYDVNVTVSIPIFSFLFLLVIHVMGRYIEENQRLKKDNDLFI